MLGSALAERLAVGVGDTVAVVSFRTNTGSGVPLPNGRTLTVSGIVDLGVYQWNVTLAYCSWDEAQGILGRLGEASVVEARVYRPAEAELTADLVSQSVHGPYYCINWMDRNRSLLEMLDVHRSVMTIILALIVLVAAFNVASGLTMGVSSRRREIGVLRAMGARRRLVGGLFALEGLAIGLAGMLIGVGMGAAAAVWAGHRGVMKLAPDVYQLSTLPSLLRVSDVLLVGGIATVVAVLAALYPAVRASRLDPATAIRYE